MLRVLLPENQSYKNIYLSLNNFFDSLDRKDWLIQYLNWEINLITALGFGFDFDIKKITNLNSKKVYNLKIDNIEYKIPFFLLSKKFNNIKQQEIYEGLNFCRNLMENKFFIPNNIKFPQSRKLLENKFLKVN